MDAQIFLPAFYLASWTFVVFLFATFLRFYAVFIASDELSVEGEEWRHPPFQKGSLLLKNAQRNLVNLFEFPLLFYVVCVIAYVTENVTEKFLFLAYLFLYLRIAHSGYHIFFNRLAFGGFPLRALIWLPGVLVIAAMWLDVANAI